MNAKRQVLRWTAAALVVGGGLLMAFVVFANGWPLPHKEIRTPGSDVIQSSQWEIDWERVDWSLEPGSVGCGGPRAKGDGIGPGEFCFSGDLRQGYDELVDEGKQHRMLILAACSLILVGALGGGLAVLKVLGPAKKSPSEDQDEVSESGQSSCQSLDSPPR